MYGFIYLTTNKINGKKYVGMCKSTHEKNYLGSGKLIKQAIKKYGKENFERVVLQECDTFEELSKAEKHWIEKYNAVDSDDFYNLTDGGFGGNSDFIKGYWSTFTKEERKNCRRWTKRDMTGEKNPMYGKQHSEDTKKLIGSKSVNRNWKKHDYKGQKNPRSKKVMIELCGETLHYSCLKDFSDSFKELSYSMLKHLAQTQKVSEKHKLKITYV
jgi:group I intron endonuclease